MATREYITPFRLDFNGSDNKYMELSDSHVLVSSDLGSVHVWQEGITLIEGTGIQQGIAQWNSGITAATKLVFPANPTINNLIELPYKSGTVALTSDISDVIAPPIAPTSLILSQSGGTAIIQFGKSVTTGCNYEIWGGYDAANYNLIGYINNSTELSTMTVVDDSFNKNGSMTYKVYAVKNGVQSAALSGVLTIAGNVPEVSELIVTASADSFTISYLLPTDNRLNTVEVWVDVNTVEANLLEVNAVRVYYGTDEGYVYNILVDDLNKYHKFWIKTTTR